MITDDKRPVVGHLTFSDGKPSAHFNGPGVARITGTAKITWHKRRWTTLGPGEHWDCWASVGSRPLANIREWLAQEGVDRFTIPRPAFAAIVAHPMFIEELHGFDPDKIAPMGLGRRLLLLTGARGFEITEGHGIARFGEFEVHGTTDETRPA